MIIEDKTIDGGKGFDWGRVSAEYAKYRDIYPQEFYQKILDLGLCKDGQKVLDIEPEPAFFQEIFIPTEQNGLARIFQRSKFNKQSIYPKEWILIIIRYQQKT